MTKKGSANKSPSAKIFRIARNVALFVLLLILVPTTYFAVLIAVKPQNFPYLTAKVETKLKDKFGNRTSLDKVYLSLNKRAHIIVTVKDLAITNRPTPTSDEQSFHLPKVELEFTLPHLVLGNFIPSKIKILDSKINLVDFAAQAPEQAATQSPINEQLIFDFLANLKQEKIRDIAIENGQLGIKVAGVETNILIRFAELRLIDQAKNLHLNFESSLTLNHQDQVNFSTSCLVSFPGSLNCSLAVNNLAPASIAELHPSLKKLANINTNLDLAADLSLNNAKFENFSFKINAADGNFNYPEFFSQQIDFFNLKAEGKYDGQNLNISKIEALFTDDLAAIKTPAAKSSINSQIHSIYSKYHDRLGSFNSKKPDALEEGSAPITPELKRSYPAFAMSLTIYNLLEPNRIDLDIKLKNTPINQIEKFWPVSLSAGGSRTWVVTHLKNGKIDDAFVRFTLNKTAEEFDLTTLDSGVVFSAADLAYSESFPEITGVDGFAKFTKKGMKIKIAKGKVLESAIDEAEVTIDDFSKPVLAITGKMTGKAHDTLKHIEHRGEFAAEIEKIFKGNARSEVDVRIPLYLAITLPNVYLKINSSLSGLNSDYLQGETQVSVFKNFRNNNINVALNLDKIAFKIKELNLEKDLNSNGALSLVVDATTKQVALKNILLWKESTTTNTYQATRSRISGNVTFALNPFLIIEAKLRNQNFGQNSYSLNYTYNRSAATLHLIGTKLDLRPILAALPLNSDSPAPANFFAEVKLDKILLLNHHLVENVQLNINCAASLCYGGNIEAKYDTNKSLKLKISRSPKEQFSMITGYVKNVSYLADAVGVSNQITDGDLKVKIKNEVSNKKPAFSGEIEISGITVYENSEVKRLAKDTLFSTIKDKIFSEGKTYFDTVKAQFDLKSNVLNIESLIANNYKIGITAKGTINLKNKIIDLKGMIIPGFIINNLFGIGNIPVIGSISGLLTGGQGGGLFGIRYSYYKKGKQDAVFTTYTLSAFVPVSIRNLFDMI